MYLANVLIDLIPIREAAQKPDQLVLMVDGVPLYPRVVADERPIPTALLFHKHAPCDPRLLLAGEPRSTRTAAIPVVISETVNDHQTAAPFFW
jgi:hypothetical protein